MDQRRQLTVQVNGETRSVAPTTTLREIVENVVDRRLNIDGTPENGGRLGVAAAVAGSVVPRGRWHTTGVTDGAIIDIVTAAQGG